MQMKKLVKYISIVLVMLAMTSNKGIAIDLAENKYTDIQEHWARDTIQVWTDYDIIKGYEGKFRPDDYMTRGEVAAVLDRIFKYVELSESSFTDINNSIHANSLLKLHNKKVINGYPDGRVKPEDYISREEMAVLINKAFEIDFHNYNEDISYFMDQSDISTWAKNDVLGLAKKGYLMGDEKKAFNPKEYTTRGEVITIIDNIIGDLYNKPQSYRDNNGKLSVINTENVTLKNISLKNKLIISEGVAEGDVTLDNVKSKEDILIRGGGENSIIVKGKSDIKNIIAKKSESGVHIIIEADSNVESLYIDDGSDNVIIRGKVETVIIESASNNIFFKDADIKNIIVSRENTNIHIDEKSKVDTIMINKTAKDTKISVEGLVSKVRSEAANTILAGKGKVDKVDLKGEKSEDKTEKVKNQGDSFSSESSRSSNAESSGPSKDSKPEVNPELPVESEETPRPPLEPETPRPEYYSMFINVDGKGHIRVEKVDEIRPPIDPRPPMIEKPNLIIIINGEGRVSAELVKELEPDEPLAKGNYEIKIDKEGKGKIIIEKIN